MTERTPTQKKSIIDRIKAFKNKVLKDASEMPMANPMGYADKTTIEQMKRMAEKKQR